MSEMGWLPVQGRMVGARDIDDAKWNTKRIN
jgi:hypothetical protein